MSGLFHFCAYDFCKFVSLYSIEKGLVSCLLRNGKIFIVIVRKLKNEIYPFENDIGNGVCS